MVLPIIEMKIILEPNGNFSLQGFPTDKIKAYGILKMAEKVMDDWFAKHSSPILVPDLHAVPAPPGGDNGQR